MASETMSALCFQIVTECVFECCVIKNILAILFVTCFNSYADEIKSLEYYHCELRIFI